MVRFRDMTFCGSDCINTQCYRHYGVNEANAAERWWGGKNPRVAFSDFSKGCPEYIAPRELGQSREEVIK